MSERNWPALALDFAQVLVFMGGTPVARLRGVHGVHEPCGDAHGSAHRDATRTRLRWGQHHVARVLGHVDASGQVWQTRVVRGHAPRGASGRVE